jgi:hypothetical protein
VVLGEAVGHLVAQDGGEAVEVAAGPEDAGVDEDFASGEDEGVCGVWAGEPGLVCHCLGWAQERGRGRVFLGAFLLGSSITRISQS